MKNVRLLVAIMMLWGAGVLTPAAALTVGDLRNICEQTPGPCEENGLLQAWVGGALDLVAVLHEQTEYVDPIYCKPTKLLFDVPAIIRYMRAHANEGQDRNAMILLVRFLEEFGGC